MILGMAAAVIRPTSDYITAALTTITNADVLAWCRSRLGISLAAKRYQAFNPTCGTNSG
jgi:hypothetical protein